MLRKSTTQDWDTCESLGGSCERGVVSDIAANHMGLHIFVKKHQQLVV